MKIIFRIAFRNLIRQKRRNILLGTGIAFGIMVLFISQSYTKGLSDILINSFISRIFGHIQINSTEINDRSIPIIRDKHEMLDIINSTIDVNYCWESVSTLTRAVGNRTGSLMVIVGLNRTNTDFVENLDVIDGDMDAFMKETVDVPLILYSPKAEELNVKAGDTVSVKLTTIYGQIQSARMTVAAVIKPENIFMTMAGFISLDTLKELLGYRPHETSRINIVLNRIDKPVETVSQANLLHTAFKPEPLLVVLSLKNNKEKTKATAAGLIDSPELKPLFLSEFNLNENCFDKFTQDPSSVVIGMNIAQTLSLSVNDRITIGYETKYDGHYSSDIEYSIKGIIDKSNIDYKNAIFFNASVFNKLCTEFIPETTLTIEEKTPFINNKSLSSLILQKAILLDRPAGSKEWKRVLKTIRNYRQPGTLLHITSMNETAEDVLKIESALNIICTITVIILFAIILTGSVNALRMTIRERTREIGTVRSIGMQKESVIKIFVIESALLALFSSLSGIGVACIIMTLLSGITFQVDNLFSILIDNGHLHFLPELKTVLADILITITVTVLTTWLPAKNAAEMPVTEALRHYE